MTEIVASHIIEGVKIAKLRVFSDDRGQFLEFFRKEWFPERRWDIVQANRSESRRGVLRGLHYHHRQVDYWHVTRGAIRVGLADLRSGSSTYMAVQTIDLEEDVPLGLFIPIGVAHGFVTISDATLCYVVDNYYDGNDELGVAWNDKALGVDWGIDSPILSDRDLNNPYLHEIPFETRPSRTS